MQLLMLLSSSLFALCTQASGKTLVIGTTEYPPYTSQSSKHNGFVNRVIAHAFKNKNIEVDFAFVPWQRALNMSREGNYDGLSFSFESANRRKSFLFSDPVSKHDEVFFHMRTNIMPDWERLSDLEGKRFGATRGYLYTQEFWGLGKKGVLNIETTATDELNFKKLIAGRIDLFPMDSITGWLMIRTKISTYMEVLTTHPKPLRSTAGFFCISKHLPNANALMTLFNEGLQQLKQDGRYDQFEEDLIYGRY